MLFDKRSTRSGFKVFFKIECQIFIINSKIKNQIDRKSFGSRRYMAFLVAIETFFQIVSTTSVWSVFAF